MSPLRVGVLAYPGCFASEVFGVPDLLTMAGHVAGAARGTPYEVAIVSPRRRVTAAGGVAIAVAPHREVDVLIVPGFELTPRLDLEQTLKSLRPELETIRSSSLAGVAIVSICVGAFLLGESGLLNGRRSTTAWLFADELAKRYPATEVRADRLVITESGVTTTAAFSAMYDFALALIRKHSGPGVARSTARLALLDDARSTQTPYVDERLLPTTGSDFCQGVQRWLDQRLAERYDLDALADAFHVSTRTLLRRFGAETGQSPLAYLQQSRVRRARHLLESTDKNIGSIAVQVGYRDPSTFASVFARHAGRSPRDYRRAFQQVQT